MQHQKKAGKAPSNKRPTLSPVKVEAKQQNVEPLILDPSNPVLPGGQESGTKSDVNSETTVESKE